MGEVLGEGEKDKGEDKKENKGGGEKENKNNIFIIIIFRGYFIF